MAWSVKPFTDFRANSRVNAFTRLCVVPGGAPGCVVPHPIAHDFAENFPRPPLKTIMQAIALVAYLSWGGCVAIASGGEIKPGEQWLDQRGAPINAHGGGVVFFEGRYYWYGEHKLPQRSEQEGADGGVHCYSSANLAEWKDEGLVLPVEPANPSSDLAAGCILERPKVLFNEQTHTWVMFFKLYPAGTGYDTGYVGVATAANPVGPFRYRHKFLGGGSPKGSGDFAMVQGPGGAAYHLTVRKPDKVFVAGRLRDDYLFPKGSYVPVEGIEVHTEAPAVFRHHGVYYLIGSGSSSWKPNAARLFVADQPTGPYRSLGNPMQGGQARAGFGPEVTFGGQISFVLPVAGKPDAFIALFDLWKPERPIEGRYMWLPIWVAGNCPSIKWRESWDLTLFDQADQP